MRVGGVEVRLSAAHRTFLTSVNMLHALFPRAPCGPPNCLPSTIHILYRFHSQPLLDDLSVTCRDTPLQPCHDKFGAPC